MPNANFITQFEYRLNNLTGSETQADLLSLRATADKYPELDIAAVALLDAAIDLDADALTNSSTIKELVTVGNADAEIKSSSEGVTEVISIGNQVGAGATGEIYSIDPGAGLRVQIIGLAPRVPENDIEIKFGGRIVWVGRASDTASTATLSILQGYPGTTANEYNGIGTISSAKGYQGEILTITKTSGTTSDTVYLSYIITD